MFKKLRKSISGFFTAPRLESAHLTLEATIPTMDSQEEARRERNQEALALANLNLQKDAYQKNLIVLHRSVMVALFATVVAIVLGVVAIAEKSAPVTVTPNVTVKVAK